MWRRLSLYAHPTILILPPSATDFAILFHFRHKINPPNCDRIDALQRRNDDPDLKPISFLFNCYAPHAYGFEIFDSYRRIIMQGVLTFAGINGWTTGPAVLGILLALCSGIVMREVADLKRFVEKLHAKREQVEEVAPSDPMILEALRGLANCTSRSVQRRRTDHWTLTLR